MALDLYRKKRDFKLTPEPRAGKSDVKGDPIFVVQLHHASHRHYDFRLQVGNTLKSWAVPKGPSFDPAVKRLAVEVEDHPISYAKFEGDIPQGQYGAGHVDIFDHGTWSTAENVQAQLSKGHLHFELQGDRLHGAWHLVRSHKPARQPQWMLFKARDEFASATEADDLVEQSPVKLKRNIATKPKRKPAIAFKELAKRSSSKTKHDWAAQARVLKNSKSERVRAEAFEPELARSVDRAPEGEDWLHETKWDGYRILTTIVNGKARFWSRNGLEWTARLPTLVRAIEQLSLQSAKLDGELIAKDRNISSFNELQAVLSGEKSTALIYAIFDLIHIDGVSVADCPLLDRKQLLQQVLASAPSSQLLFSEHVLGQGAQVFTLAAKQGLEGILSKRANSNYRAGRNNDWLKVKSVLSDEFAIVGYTEGKGSRKGVGALLLGKPDKKGSWRYAGRVGSGFSDVLVKKFRRLLAPTQRDSSPVTKTSLVDRDIGKALWVEPKYVVEVFYRGLGKEGLLRQASLKTLREDKSLKDLMNEPDSPVKAKPKISKRSKAAVSAAPKFEFGYLTHPERVVYPQDGITKLQAAEYYEAAMPWLLPQIVNRPLSIVRCPDGIKNACFFQKHHTPQLGEHIRSVAVREADGKTDRYLYVDDAEGLRELVQMNVLEFHPWGTTIDALDSADLLTFDLDPGPGVTWKKIADAAELVRQLLHDLKLESFVKLSGGKGLHVVVPLNPSQPWEIAKAFCRQLAAALAKDRPKEFLDVATKRQRDGRIFVDYLRNSRGATSVAAYSLRARAGAPVAMPIEWNEIHRAKQAALYRLENTPDYLTKRKKDPWQAISVKQTFGDYAKNVIEESHDKPKRKKS